MYSLLRVSPYLKQRKPFKKGNFFQSLKCQFQMLSVQRKLQYLGKIGPSGLIFNYLWCFILRTFWDETFVCLLLKNVYVRSLNKTCRHTNYIFFSSKQIPVVIVGCTKHRAGCIKHRAGCIKHRAGCITDRSRYITITNHR